MAANYVIALRHTRDGYSVSVPGLPGCWSQGKTKKEAIANIREAIVDYLAVATALAAKRAGKDAEGEVRKISVPV